MVLKMYIRIMVAIGIVSSVCMHAADMALVDGLFDVLHPDLAALQYPGGRAPEVIPSGTQDIYIPNKTTEIFVENTSPVDVLYARIYVAPFGVGMLTREPLWNAFGPIYELKKGVRQKILRPYFNVQDELASQRLLVYTTTPDRLEDILEKEQADRFPYIAVGRKMGSERSFTISSYQEKEIPTKPITIVNATKNQTFYGALYRSPINVTQSRIRLSEPVEVPADSRVVVPRPVYTFADTLKHYLRFFTSDYEDGLPERLSYETGRSMSSVDASPIRGTTFYFTGYPLKGYSEIAWRLKPLADGVVNAVQQTIKIVLVIVKPAIDLIERKLFGDTASPWATQVARARITTGELHPEERAAVDKRSAAALQMFQQRLGKQFTPDTMPRIGIVYSGGGFRAMVGSAGAQKALADTGLLDVALYHSVLSGSTWYLAPWMTSGQTVDTFNGGMRKRVGRGVWGLFKNITATPELLAFLTVQLYKRFSNQQKLSLIGFYGLMLSYNLLRDLVEREPGKYRATESFTIMDQYQRAISGTTPFPVYTACIGETGGSERRHEYQWFEVTPVESGSWYLGCFVPSWGLGRIFDKGASINNAQPLSLGYLMGIFGSAISASLRDAYEQALKEASFVLERIGRAVAESALGDVRILPAQIPNPTLHLPSAPFNTKMTITLVDAGVASGVPIEPLLHKERKLDVLIVVDHSGIVSDARELEAAAINARAHALPFPKNIDYRVAGTSRVSVWGLDEDGYDGPVIIYIPRTKNDSYDPSFDPSSAKFVETTNFVYTSEQVQLLSGLLERNVKDSVQTIERVIDQIAERKAKKRLVQTVSTGA